MSKPKKPEVITFKASPSLIEAMGGIANRSEFIRDAVLAALENMCPLCRGSGILTPKQQEHWTQFARNHSVKQCHECDEFHLTCAYQGKKT